MQDAEVAAPSKSKTGASSGAKVAGIGKDPSTETAFLPDKEREQQEQHLREQLKQEYELRQQVCTDDLDWHRLQDCTVTNCKSEKSIRTVTSTTCFTRICQT